MAIEVQAARVEESDNAGPKESALAWYGLIVLLMTTLFAYVVRQMLNLIGPSLQTTLGFDDLKIGLLQGLGMAIFASIASYPMGWLADRFGRRLILAIGVAVWSLATLSCAFQQSFSGLLAATIGISIGEAGLAPIIYAMIPDLFPERRRNAANFIFYTGSMLGAGAGMALGGALLHGLAISHGDLPAWLAGIDTWRVAMMAVALPAPLFFLLVLTMPLGRKSAPPPKAADGEQPTGRFLPYVKAHWRALVCVYGSIFAMAVCMTSALIWFPLALPRIFHIDPTTVGGRLGTVIAIATLVGVLLPVIVLTVRRRAVERHSLALASAFIWLTPLPMAALPFVRTPFEAYVIAAIVGAMGVAASSLMPGVLQNLAPLQLRSRVLAILGIANALALAISPMAIGALSGLFAGPRGILQAIAVVSVPALAASALLAALAVRPYAKTVEALQDRSVETRA
ncbi:MAG TPA: MFS transporter [Caulobacteraceae bacterium]|jgi:MFS family permease|nr:MFS transporter [Caulobacteraceae bacterium]